MFSRLGRFARAHPIKSILTAVSIVLIVVGIILLTGVTEGLIPTANSNNPRRYPVNNEKLFANYSTEQIIGITCVVVGGCGAFGLAYAWWVDHDMPPDDVSAQESYRVSD